MSQPARLKKQIITLFFAGLVISCASTEIVVEDAAKQAAVIAARPVLEKIFYAEAPVSPSHRELFPTIQRLPGHPFDPGKHFGSKNT